mmetsp:Transcript_30142/g.69354  ORF Transcript_30142/g.69354 Transcript_30142/m.69354 type:complete len:271 (-) Transcript_30142:688-1500(-)
MPSSASRHRQHSLFAREVQPLRRLRAPSQCDCSQPRFVSKSLARLVPFLDFMDELLESFGFSMHFAQVICQSIFHCLELRLIAGYAQMQLLACGWRCARIRQKTALSKHPSFATRQLLGYVSHHSQEVCTIDAHFAIHGTFSFRPCDAKFLRLPLQRIRNKLLGIVMRGKANVAAFDHLPFVPHQENVIDRAIGLQPFHCAIGILHLRWQSSDPYFSVRSARRYPWPPRHGELVKEQRPGHYGFCASAAHGNLHNSCLDQLTITHFNVVQ